MSDLAVWLLNTAVLVTLVALVLVGLNLLVNRREARDHGIHLVKTLEGAGFHTYCGRWLSMSANRAVKYRSRTTCLACGEAYDKEKGWMRSQ